jgi:catechol 2,3-dioxygenase-like lactoylglutathione lyase family enzyme
MYLFNKIRKEEIIMNYVTRGIDHIGVTVPDMEQATQFFKDTFGAKISYDNVTPDETPLEGSDAEKILGVEKGAKAIHLRLLVIGESATIEMFKYINVDHKSPVDATDYGLQHVAFYVDDIEYAANKFVENGGALNTPPNDLLGHREHGENHKFVYGRTPWGMLVEMIQYPQGINYPESSEAQRWTPPKN